MARHSKIKIENVTDRLKLAPRAAPYGFVSIGPGLRLGYRRVKDKTAPGTWIAKKADGSGGDSRRAIGFANDHQVADGVNVFDFHQAAEQARKLLLGLSTSAPSTWARAIDDYEEDLKTRDGAVSNATHVRFHLRDYPELLNKHVALLTTAELRRWRNNLVKHFEKNKRKQSSVARLLKSTKASLNLAASQDSRIQNREAWRVGLGGLTDTYDPIDRVQPDTIVHQIIIEADRLDAAFGLFIRVAAETGARPSQIARLQVADLQADRLAMPSSKKGRKRVISRRSVPISPDLTRRLQRVAKGRDADSPLLLHADGCEWNLPDRRHLREPFALVAKRVGIKETMYCLRHSAIVRALLAGVPARLVAANADTSLMMLECTYARFISHHGEDVARRGLLASVPATENVVSLPGRQ